MSEGSEKVKFGYFDTFRQFAQNGPVTFLYFLGIILINCQEMVLIELFKRSFSRPERSALVHFPTIIDIIQ